MPPADTPLLAVDVQPPTTGDDMDPVATQPTGGQNSLNESAQTSAAPDLLIDLDPLPALLDQA